MKDLLVVIMAHGAAQTTFDRHLPYWKAADAPMVVVYPKDDPVQTPHFAWPIGRRCHNGPESIARFREMLRLLHRADYKTSAFFEYDAVNLGASIARPLVTMGNVFRDTNPAQNGFVGTTYIHPPIIFPHDALEHLMRVTPKYGDEVERGFWDRWLGLIYEREGIPLINIMSTGQGYAHNTIEPEHLPSAIDAASRGAQYFHGVKTPEVLAAITKAYHQP